MTSGPQHEIANLAISPGELAFDARIGEVSRRVFFRSETGFEPYPEAALAAALMPAMRSGGTLEMNEPISPRVLRNQREFQAIQCAWSLKWTFQQPPLREVEVAAPTQPLEPRDPTGRVATFFSGGVDSWATILGEPEVTDLIFVRGVDILDSMQGPEFADRVEARLRKAAAEVGLPLHVVETNLRELSEPLRLSWDAFFGCAMAAIALYLGPAFDRVLIAGGSDYEVQEKFGANWLVDQLWSNESLEIVDAGGRFSRVERIEQIASHPTVRTTLRVCWQNPDGAYNCGRCGTCLMTMAILDAIGALEEMQTFPSEIDLEAVAGQRQPTEVLLRFWEDTLDAARKSGKTDLERALAKAVAGTKSDLGLPPAHRRRHHPAPPSSLAPDPREGTLFTTPATAEAIAGAGAIAFLVGGYDGSGNYGDIALLDAALDLLDGFDDGLLALPVVERQFAAAHETLAREFLNRPRHVLYFDPDGIEDEDDLVPAPTPLIPGPAVSYLYGGGFLNPWWGDRKLAMLRAAEQLVAEADTTLRFSSGLQVDTGWIRDLTPADAELLRGFELLGARDDVSAVALSELEGGPTRNTGDDAVGLLGALVGAEGPGDTGDLVVNVHFAEHEWVTDRPDSAREFDVGLLAELARLAERPVRVRPLLAYLDPRVDERSGLERFVAACAERGVEIAEPRVLRPADLDRIPDDLGGAALTVSSSFHVALTSLLMAIPTVLLRDNDYYDQKARGLLADFGLPPEFSTRSSDEPVRVAAALAPHLLDPETRGQTRRGIEAAGSRMRGRRLETEKKLLALIAHGALATGGSPEADRSLAAEERAALAERRAAKAEAVLAEITSSRSWRITAPLRRLTNRGRE
jgi:polysaccharide pyruvyl transferase WcaK-like protein